MRANDSGFVCLCMRYIACTLRPAAIADAIILVDVIVIADVCLPPSVITYPAGSEKELELFERIKQSVPRAVYVQ